MNPLPQVFRRRQRYDDLSVSIQEHIAERTEELIAEGLPRAQAEQSARQALSRLIEADFQGLVLDRKRLGNAEAQVPVGECLEARTERGGTALYLPRLKSWPPTHISRAGSSPNER